MYPSPIHILALVVALALLVSSTWAKRRGLPNVAPTVSDVLRSTICQADASSQISDCHTVQQPLFVRFDGNISISGKYAIHQVKGSSDIAKLLSDAITELLVVYAKLPLAAPPSFVIDVTASGGSRLPSGGANMSITVTYGVCPTGFALAHSAPVLDDLVCIHPSTVDIWTFDNTLNTGGPFVNASDCVSGFDIRANGSAYLTTSSSCRPHLVTEEGPSGDVTVAFWLLYPSNSVNRPALLTALNLGAGPEDYIEFNFKSTYIPSITVHQSGSDPQEWSLEASWWETVPYSVHWNHYILSFGENGVRFYFNGRQLLQDSTSISLGPISSVRLGCPQISCGNMGFDNLLLSAGVLTPRQLSDRHPVLTCSSLDCHTSFNDGEEASTSPAITTSQVIEQGTKTFPFPILNSTEASSTSSQGHSYICHRETHCESTDQVAICRVDDFDFGCDHGFVIYILIAFYGRIQPGEDICPFNESATENTECYVDHSSRVSGCNGKQNCTARACSDGDLHEPDPCKGTYKYFSVHFVCVPFDESFQQPFSCEDHPPLPTTMTSTSTTTQGLPTIITDPKVPSILTSSPQIITDPTVPSIPTTLTEVITEPTVPSIPTTLTEVITEPTVPSIPTTLPEVITEPTISSESIPTPRPTVDESLPQHCQEEKTDLGTWPMSEGGQYFLPCHHDSNASAHRICCTGMSIGLGRPGGVSCTANLAGRWIGIDISECVAEAKNVVQNIFEGVRNARPPTRVEDVENISTTVISTLATVTERLKNSRQSRPVGDDFSSGDFDEETFQANLKERREVVMDGMRIVGTVVGKTLRSNVSFTPSLLHQVLDSMNRLAFLSGSNSLSLNESEVSSRMADTGIGIERASPFAYTNALLGLVHSVGRRDRQEFNSTTEDAGVGIRTSPFTRESIFEFVSHSRVGRPFRCTVPPTFAISNDDVIAVVYLDLMRSNQDIPENQQEVSSPVVDISVLSENNDGSLEVAEPSSSPLLTTFDASLPTSSRIQSLIKQYLSPDNVFPSTITLTVIGVSFASTEQTAVVLRIALSVDGNRLTSANTQSEMWESVVEAIRYPCDDNVQGPVCYSSEDATIHIPYSPSCSWWNSDDQVWLEDGCQMSRLALVAENRMLFPHNVSATGSSSFIPAGDLSSKDPSLRIECSCTHMTTFAIIVRNSPDTVAGPLQAEQQVLAIFTYIGTAVSIVSLLLTICAYLLLWSKPYVQRHHKLVVHMCIPLLVSQALLVLVLHPDTQANHGWCMFVSASLHFCLLAVSAWMLCIAYDIHGTFVTVFGGASQTTKMWKYALPVYVVAAVLVAIAAGLGHDHYRTEDFCWIDMSTDLRLVFLIPFAGALLVNTIVLVRVLANIKGRVQLKTTAFAGLTFMWILGFSWLFGIIAMFHDHIIWEYLFTIFTLGEGVFIFVHYCLRSNNVREAFLLSHESKLALRQQTMMNAKVKDYSSSKTKTQLTRAMGEQSNFNTDDSVWNVREHSDLKETSSQKRSRFFLDVPLLRLGRSRHSKIGTIDTSVLPSLNGDSITSTHSAVVTIQHDDSPWIPHLVDTPPETPPTPSKQRATRGKNSNSRGSSRASSPRGDFDAVRITVPAIKKAFVDPEEDVD